MKLEVHATKCSTMRVAKNPHETWTAIIILLHFTNDVLICSSSGNHVIVHWPEIKRHYHDLLWPLSPCHCLRNDDGPAGTSYYSGEQVDLVNFTRIAT